MKYIDLFSGIAGFRLGLEMAGFKFDWVGFSEIDPYAIKVYQKHYPDAHNLGDITRIDGRRYEGQIDLITGGFPCQDISVAGKGAGITGARSGLWKEMFGLICEIRPRYIIVENVPALLGRGIDVVLGDLASIFYDAEGGIISAQAVGAPHRRERVWIVAYPGQPFWDERTQKQRDISGQPEKRHTCGKSAGSGQTREDVADTDKQGLEVRQKPEIRQRNIRNKGQTFGKRSFKIRYPPGKGFPDWAGGEVGQPWPLTQFERPDGREVEYDFCNMAHGVSDRVAKLRCLGNAVVPQCVAWIGQRLLEVMTH